jgi:hypothetical protein
MNPSGYSITIIRNDASDVRSVMPWPNSMFACVNFVPVVSDCSKRQDSSFVHMTSKEIEILGLGLATVFEAIRRSFVARI